MKVSLGTPFVSLAYELHARCNVFSSTAFGCDRAGACQLGREHYFIMRDGTSYGVALGTVSTLHVQAAIDAVCVPSY